MEPYLLNRNFEKIDIIDDYESLIWTERYSQHGDFELDLLVANADPSQFRKGFYLHLPESNDLMIIESNLVSSDVEDGKKFKVKGRALTSVLERRTIQGQININGSAVSAGQQILNSNFISPSDTNRRISNIVYGAPGPTVDTGLAVEAQFDNEQCYKALIELMEPFDIGFRLTIGSDPKVWTFRFYGGKDYSYIQTDNPYVVFSPEFDNIQNTSYFTGLEGYANVVRVLGEGEGNARKVRTVMRAGGTPSGLDRFEDTYSSNASSNNGEIGTAAYNRLLDQDGRIALSQKTMPMVFDGEADNAVPNDYGVNYVLGDIVQIEDSGTGQGRARITEYIRAQDGTGRREFPSFEFIDNTET